MALSALAEEAEEGLPRGANGAKDADGKVDHAEVRRERHGMLAIEPVLVPSRVANDGGVGSVSPARRTRSVCSAATCEGPAGSNVLTSMHV